MFTQKVLLAPVHIPNASGYQTSAPSTSIYQLTDGNAALFDIITHIHIVCNATGTFTLAFGSTGDGTYQTYGHTGYELANAYPMVTGAVWDYYGRLKGMYSTYTVNTFYLSGFTPTSATAFTIEVEGECGVA